MNRKIAGMFCGVGLILVCIHQVAAGRLHVIAPPVDESFGFQVFGHSFLDDGTVRGHYVSDDPLNPRGDFVWTAEHGFVSPPTTWEDAIVVAGNGSAFVNVVSFFPYEAELHLDGGVYPIPALQDWVLFPGIIGTQNSISSDGRSILATHTNVLGPPSPPIHNPLPALFRPEQGWTVLPLPGGAEREASASAISANGKHAVGVANSPGDGGAQDGVYWSVNGKLEAIWLPHPPGATGSYPRDLSVGGEVIVGDGYPSGPNNNGAVLWRKADITQSESTPFEASFLSLPEGYSSSFARSVSSDGTVIVGQAFGLNGFEAALWLQADGYQYHRLQDYLIDHVGIPSSTFEGIGLLEANQLGLYEANYITPSGRFIAGEAYAEAGPNEEIRRFLWVADLTGEVVPEPSTMSLCLVVLSVACMRSRWLHEECNLLVQTRAMAPRKTNHD